MTTMRRLMLAASVLAILAGTVGCGMFGDSWQAPQAVRITSNEDLAAMLPTWVVWTGVGSDKEAQGLLLRDGDWIFGNELIVRYAAADGQALTVTTTEWNAKIGDTVVTLRIGKNKPEGIEWLRSATDRQLADLRLLSFESAIDPAALPALQRLAARNPGVDVNVEGNGKLVEALALFHPRTLFFDATPGPEMPELLQKQPQIEKLLITADERGAFDGLPALPRLRSLVLFDWNPDHTGPLPAGLSSLRSLATMTLEQDDLLKDLAPLGDAAGRLEELSLIGLQQLDLSGIEKMTRLRTLALWVGEAVDLSGLDSLTELRWVLLPPATTQAQFVAFVDGHPRLAILELMGNEEVKDLSPLASLKDLQGLVLGGPYDNMDSITALASLRFVGIPQKTWEAAPNEVEAIKKALPEALVVPVQPFCLGSGWILLVVAIPFAARWTRRRLAAQAGQAA